MPNRWLVKTEPATYSYDDLRRERRTTWDGVRNALARIHLRAMRRGDEVLVYHTGKEKAVVGLARVARAPRPDAGAEDAALVAVDLAAVRPLAAAVPLGRLRSDPRLADLELLRNSRLSVMPVGEAHWRRILELAGE